MLLVYLSHTHSLRQRVWWPFGLQLAWTCLEKSSSFPFPCCLDESLASHLPFSGPAWPSHHCFCLEKGWAWVRPIGGTQGVHKWAEEKIYKEKMKLITFQMPQKKKKIQFWVSWVFSPSSVSIFSLCFWNYKQIWLSKWVINCCPKVSVILLYRYLQDTGRAFISSVTCTVPASPVKHQNPAPLTKSSCPKELTAKYESLGNQMVPMIRRTQGKTGTVMISMRSSTVPDLTANYPKWVIGSYKLFYCSNH